MGYFIFSLLITIFSVGFGIVNTDMAVIVLTFIGLAVGGVKDLILGFTGSLLGVFVVCLLMLF